MSVEFPTIVLYLDDMDFEAEIDIVPGRRKGAVVIEFPVIAAQKLIDTLTERIVEEKHNHSIRVRFIGRIFV